MHDRHPSWPPALVLLIVLCCPVITCADEERRPVGKCLSPAGLLLQRQAADKPWQPVGPLDPVHSRDLLLTLPGAQAALKNADGSVQLVLWGNVPQLSSHPVLDSAVVLHHHPDFALDLTLDRGRVVVTNHRAKGPARVRARVQQETWELTLAEPGSSVALELYGRWPRGVPFSADPKSPERPTVSLTFFVLKGQVDLKAGAQQHALQAPPGPAYFHWDSVGGHDAGPQRRDQLPEWVEGKEAVAGARSLVREGLNRFCQQVEKKAASEVLADLLASSSSVGTKAAPAPQLQMAVCGFAALDDLPRLLDALTDEKREDVRPLAIEALRHWIGRAPGNDLVIYKALTEARKYSPAHAEIAMQLLHSFGTDDLAKPETYDVLLGYLRHDRLPLRELALWHLRRLVPEGEKVVLNPAAPAEQRESGIKEMQQLVQKALKKTPKPEK